MARGPSFTPREHAALAGTGAGSCIATSGAPDHGHAAACAEFDEKERAHHLASAIAMIACRNGLAIALRTPPDA